MGPTDVHVEDVLARCDLFRGLSPNQLAAIVPLCSHEEHRAGEMLFSEGEVADRLYVVADGKISLEMQLRIGSHATRHAAVGMVGEGEAAAWSALVPPYVLTSSGMCLERTELLVIEGSAMRRLLSRDPAIGYVVTSNLVTVVSSRLKETRETLMYFLSIVAHELKSPLAAIQSYIELMRDGFTGPVTDKQRTMLSRSGIRIREALDLMDDLLDVARLQPYQIMQEMEPTNLRGLVETALEIARRPAEEKGIALQLVAPQQMEPVMASASRLRQVLVNLIGNAVKYTPSGGDVTVRLSDAGASVAIEVVDTGIGVPAEDLPHIFEDFYRARNVQEKGAGLGLSIARKIVGAHQGAIWAESPCKENPTGRGSKFTVILPKRLRTEPLD